MTNKYYVAPKFSKLSEDKKNARYDKYAKYCRKKGSEPYARIGYMRAMNSLMDNVDILNMIEQKKKDKAHG